MPTSWVYIIVDQQVLIGYLEPRVRPVPRLFLCLQKHLLRVYSVFALVTLAKLIHQTIAEIEAPSLPIDRGLLVISFSLSSCLSSQVVPCSTNEDVFIVIAGIMLNLTPHMLPD